MLHIDLLVKSILRVLALIKTSLWGIAPPTVDSHNLSNCPYKAVGPIKVNT